MTWFLYTATHDFEGTFGDVMEFDSEEEAMAELIDFTESNKHRPNEISYRLIRGEQLLADV